MKTGRRRFAIETLRAAAGSALRVFAVMIVVSLAVALLRVAWIRVPRWYADAQRIADPKDRVTVENEIFKNIVEGIGGGFVLLGLFFTWRTLRLTREGQLTERFTKAIEQLGSDKTAIRLGGIHALARIARDSQRDEFAIMQILCEFVKQETGRRSRTASLPSDVKVALSVITSSAVASDLDYVLDLSGVDLSGAEFNNCILNRITFEDARLEAADFSGAMLRKCRFRGANLMNAIFRHADLEGTDIMAADLRNADMRWANLRDANLFGANLGDAVLFYADFRGARHATKAQFDSAVRDDTCHLPEFSLLPEVATERLT